MESLGGRCMRNTAAKRVGPGAVIDSDIEEIARRSQDDLRALEGKCVLITGGGGFLLSYLVDILAHYSRNLPSSKACRIVVVDNYKTGIPQRLAHLADLPYVRFLNVDAARPFKIGCRPHVIVHGASIASPSVYRQFPLETAEVNALGTYHLLQAAGGLPLQAFILMSSSEIYGAPEPAAIPTAETYHGNVSCTGPRACYDESKRFAETLAMIFFRTKKVPGRIIRPFNVYGPGMRLDDHRVLPDFARCVLERKDIELFSNGSPTRSFCYVSDFIVGLIHVLVRGISGEAYNVGNDQEEISVRDLARLMIDLDGQDLKVKYQTHRDSEYLADNPQRRAPDLSKLRALGFKPEINLRVGLPRYLAWARESKEIARIGGAK